MIERTKRGDDERQEEDKTLAPAKPVEAITGGRVPPADKTRDKGAAPVEDNTGDDDAAEKS